MRRDIEPQLWLLAPLASKSKSVTPANAICFLFLVVLVYLVINLIYWAHPGGPAWGRHKWSRRRNASSSCSTRTATTSTATVQLMSPWKKHSKIIPGPKGLPFIGSMDLMAGLAHHKIAAAAAACQAKRLMAFSLGETRVIVTCNPEVAREILNSSDFGDRPMKESAYSLMFNRAIGFAPYGVYWRTLRRIAATHLFCPKQIKASQSQRFEIASQMVETMTRRGGKESVVPVRDVLKLASLNHMMCSVFGRKYSLVLREGEEEEDGSHSETDELRKLVDEGYNLLGVFNWSDHLPWLADFDLQKVRFRCSNLVPKVNRFVSRIIDQHKKKAQHRHQGDQHTQFDRDFVDVLLNLEGPDKLSDSDMIAVLWEMIFRGTDTVAVLVEWVLARMVIHPEVQTRVQQELDQLSGGGSRALVEPDIADAAYLPAVVKEVLRLHPPGPLLSWARLAVTDTTVDGQNVPRGTTAMVNMWAITRDPQVWSDPLEFNPDRFLTKPECGGGGNAAGLCVLGSDLRLAPFGSGRRSCPGKALGLTTVTFWVASLLHEFEFEFGGEGAPDLGEVLRLSCEMAEPLRVRVRPRRLLA
ncbi:cytochrome P450 78A9-like [Coffea arabica]|uniref:Cytochrome P450 78A9-like n=1 Tax=Coffea arabica TaxID=13443 RepID=A0A6P6WJ96_COFAR|nr:cytochrome P450 78A9-like [Coffea arabica]